MIDVLITGASRGIGRALADEYLARGARVFAAMRDPDRAPRGAGVPGRLVVVPMDVTSGDQIRAAAAAVAAQTDGIDLLVNNAGIGHTTTGLSEVDGDRMLEILKVNTIGPLLVTQAFRPLLRPGARVVNITMATPPITKLKHTAMHAFFASRYAHNALTKMVAAELTDVTVVALWPGYLRTDLNDHAEEATSLADGIPPVVDLIERLGPDDHGTCLLADGTRYGW